MSIAPNEQALLAVLNVLPEVRQLESVLDNFYYKQHSDKKISELASIFSALLAKHPSCFAHLNTNQKSQILFDKYRELTLDELLKTTEYQAAFDNLRQKVNRWVEEPFLLKELHKNYLGRVHYLHSDVPAFALAHVFQTHPNLIILSSVYQPRFLSQGMD